MRVLMAMITVLMLTATTGAQTIRLMARVGVSDQVVRLGNIATIEDASVAVKERLAMTVIVPKLDGEKVIHTDEILFAVLQQNPDLSLASTLIIRGAAQCTVVPEGASPIAAAPAAAPAALPSTVLMAPTTDHPLANRPIALTSDEAAPPAPAIKTSAAPATAAAPAPAVPATQTAEKPLTHKFNAGSLADLIATQTLKDFGATVYTLEVEFTSTDPLIFSAAPAGQKWTFIPTMGKSLGTMQWEAKLLKDNAPVKDIWVQARLRKPVSQLVTTEDLKRGGILTAEMMRVTTIMADRPTDDLVIDPKEMVGMESTRAMAAGTPINRHDFQAADAIQAQDLITVYYSGGGFELKLPGKALSTARYHESVRIERENKEVVVGTAIGKRIAVVGSIDAATEQKIREAK